MIKGALENIDQNYHQAILHFVKALERSVQNRNTYTSFEIAPMISTSYGKLGDFEKATKYSWQYVHVLDSIHSSHKKTNNITLIASIKNEISEDVEHTKIPLFIKTLIPFNL